MFHRLFFLRGSGSDPKNAVKDRHHSWTIFEINRFPYSFNGAGTLCWQSNDLGSYLNSWNLASLTINGVNETNLYVASASYPAQIGGYWYVSYNSSVTWGHFEANK